ncbi:hypothetical protein CK217_23020 [Mesorhizobium loti]|nr:hypothetical protein BAE38_20425 [Mesorhizobium loti]PBB59542.1 hypothetical protein CK217_23020 [Mesorhizobium loti]PBC14280.1 hypothetical protein CK225_21270 [Mesorhizobium loti]
MSNLDQSRSRFIHRSLVRLQEILQGRLDGVVVAGIAGARLGLIRGKIRARPRRLVLVVARSANRLEDVQQVCRHRSRRKADQLAERRMLAGITVAVGRAGLQELCGVLESQRVGRDVGVMPAVALAS